MITTGAIGFALMFTSTTHAVAKNKIAGQTLSITGCLTQDPKEKDEYLITGADGKTWGMRSHTVRLGEHLNHKVTVTGKVTKGEHGGEAGDMNITNLQMVSPTCK
jgi:hypothetical protein